MDRRRELGEFLAAKRAQVAPDSAQLPFARGHRRVAGLRREEVAWLAGISDTYYTRMERGKVGGISDAVLRGLIEALQLTPQEASYIASTITVTGWNEDDGDASVDEVPPVLQRLLDGLTAQPVLVLNERCDYVAHNAAARALYPYHFADGRWSAGRPVNSIRFLFLDPRARTFYVDWVRAANQGVAYLRSSAARHPREAGIAELISELRAASEEFAAAWERRDAHFDPEGVRSIHHPEVGRLDLEYQTLLVVGHPALRLTTYSAPEGSPTAARLERLVTA